MTVEKSFTNEFYITKGNKNTNKSIWVSSASSYFLINQFTIFIINNKLFTLYKSKIKCSKIIK
jgi:hypothetical protein